jgi:hypothetical protein
MNHKLSTALLAMLVGMLVAIVWYSTQINADKPSNTPQDVEVAGL